MELPNIAAYAYQDVHVWSALLTYMRLPPNEGNILVRATVGVVSAIFATMSYFSL